MPRPVAFSMLPRQLLSIRTDRAGRPALPGGKTMGIPKDAGLDDATIKRLIDEGTVRQSVSDKLSRYQEG